MIYTLLEAYWWDLVFYSKENFITSHFPLWGGRKYPQNDPQKGCVIIAQFAGVDESHFWNFFLRLRLRYIKATFEGVLGKKIWAQDFPIVLVPPLTILHQSRRAFLLIFYIGKYRKTVKIAFSCFKHPKWRCLSKFHTRCHRARCQRQGGHWYWNYWKILEYTGKIFHTGIILEKHYFLEKSWKIEKYTEIILEFWNFNTWKYWNFFNKTNQMNFTL